MSKDLPNAQEPGDALRQCALTLHAVGSDDRKWFLANLPRAQADELERLLEELTALGIPADARVAEAALKSAGSTAANAGTRQARHSKVRSSGVDCLRNTSAAKLARVLSHEPPALVGQVISMCGAAERTAVLATLGPAQRRQVQDMLPSIEARHPDGPGARASEALLQQLSLSLASMPDLAGFGGLRSLAAGWRARWPRVRGVSS